MSQFTKIVVRCAVDVTSRDPFKDVFTGSVPKVWYGVGVEFQLAFFKGTGPSAALLDISDFNLVKALITSASTSNTALVDQLATTLDTGLTLDEWNSGVSARTGFERAAHAIIDFEGSQLQFDLAGGASKDFWLTIHGATTDDLADPDCFGCTTFTILADSLPPVVGPLAGANLIPQNAVYDGSSHYTLATAVGQGLRWTKGANDTSVTNTGETVNTNNAVFWAQAATIVLNGTAGQPVTAFIWYPPALTADEVLALFNSAVVSRNVTSGTGSPNGVVTGSPGDLFSQIENNALVRLWTKTSGVATNTGWT
jgi:hypothetical protein